MQSLLYITRPRVAYVGPRECIARQLRSTDTPGTSRKRGKQARPRAETQAGDLRDASETQERDMGAPEETQFREKHVSIH